jgi:hypothetical protein
MVVSCIHSDVQVILSKKKKASAKLATFKGFTAIRNLKNMKNGTVTALVHGRKWLNSTEEAWNMSHWLLHDGDEPSGSITTTNYLISYSIINL